VCVRARACVRAYTHTCARVCVHACICVRARACTCVRVCACVHVHVHRHAGLLPRLVSPHLWRSCAERTFVRPGLPSPALHRKPSMSKWQGAAKRAHLALLREGAGAGGGAGGGSGAELVLERLLSGQAASSTSSAAQGGSLFLRRALHSKAHGVLLPSPLRPSVWAVTGQSAEQVGSPLVRLFCS